MSIHYSWLIVQGKMSAVQLEAPAVRAAVAIRGIFAVGLAVR